MSWLGRRNEEKEIQRRRLTRTCGGEHTHTHARREEEGEKRCLY
jgi:hypothetical protein